MIVNRTGCGKKQFRLNFRYFSSIRWRDWVKPWKSSVSIVGVPFEVRTSNLMNASPEALPVEPACSMMKRFMPYSLGLTGLYRRRICTSASEAIVNLQGIKFIWCHITEMTEHRYSNRETLPLLVSPIFQPPISRMRTHRLKQLTDFLMFLKL
jgi:hypothetical protein